MVAALLGSGTQMSVVVVVLALGLQILVEVVSERLIPQE